VLGDEKARQTSQFVGLKAIEKFKKYSHMSSIFLSHSHADKPFARRLAADLRLAGHAVWIDEAEINIGDSLIEKIRDGLDQVDYVAAILSSASIASSWVTKELDIASNREIKEKRAVVLPLMVEKVDLPGFLMGKFYGDFTDPAQYQDTLRLLLRKLGPSQRLAQPEPNELEMLKQQLAAAQAAAAQHESALKAHQTFALRGKSPALVEAINKANKSHPSHAPINATYAFEVGSMPMTLDYLLWCIGKAQRRGSHPMDFLITIENKWGEVKAMLQAYSDLLNAQ
jgi:hypothetical protein